MDVLADGAWENIFTEKPEVFTKEEKREWLDKLTDVTLGSDAFFPFFDNIERAHKSGVKYIAHPGLKYNFLDHILFLYAKKYEKQELLFI